MGMKSSDEPFVRLMDRLRCTPEKKIEGDLGTDKFTFSKAAPRSFITIKKLYSASVQ